MSRIPALVSACLALLVAQASFGEEGASAEPSLDPGGPIGTTMTLHPVADPDAPAVTQQNLMASERFWPYHVELVRSWTPEAGEKPLAAGRRGVLIRVDSSELARIDFGRHGQHAVPIGATDLLASANRIRLGELRKLGPNFALAIGPRVFSRHGNRLLPVSFAETVKNASFLCVFADPSAEGFPELAASLAPLRTRPGLMSILFPQGQQTDAEVDARLEEVGWPVPFVIAHLKESYTRSLLTKGLPPPVVTLQTNEGRLLFEETWSRDAVAKLSKRLDAEPAGTSLAATPGVAKPPPTE